MAGLIGISKNQGSSQVMPRWIAKVRTRAISRRVGSEAPDSQFDTVPCETPATSAMTFCESLKMFFRTFWIGFLADRCNKSLRIRRACSAIFGKDEIGTANDVL